MTDTRPTDTADLIARWKAWGHSDYWRPILVRETITALSDLSRENVALMALLEATEKRAQLRAVALTFANSMILSGEGHSELSRECIRAALAEEQR